MSAPLPGPGNKLSQIVRASGTYFFPSSSAAASTSILQSSQARGYRWVADSSFILAQLGAEVTVVGDAGCTLRLGIYADNGQGFPGNLLLDSGTIPGDAVNAAAFSNVVSFQIVAGTVYWLVSSLSVIATTAPTVRICSNPQLGQSPNFGNTPPGTGATPMGYIVGGTAGALPNPFTPLSSANFAPRLIMKVQ